VRPDTLHSVPFTVDQIRQALIQRPPRLSEPDPTHLEAAVALVLAGEGADLSLCAIRRAEHPLDPWSGHMALPGGRVDPGDAGPRQAAERETREEVGIALGEEHWLGSLSHLPVRLGSATDRQMILWPFLYYWGEKPGPFVPNEEVAEAFWIPLAHLWDPAQAIRFPWDRAGNRLLYPAIRFQDTAIWGITYRVLTIFSDVLDAPLPHLEDLPG
jgi:8-oxo-dGTP pyrophosphatase MutT (NUDIX family)